MRVFLLMTMLLGLNVFSVQAKDDESLIKSFTLIKWDAVAHATINEKECLLEFKHLPSGNLVTGVNYELAKGVSISPNPQDFVGKWPKEVVFTLKKGKKEVKYKMVLCDYVSANEYELGSWKLIWNEEFNEEWIDWTVWSKTPRQNSNWNDTMTDDEELYDMKDGRVVLYGRDNIDNKEDSSPYLTGGLWGLNKVAFSLGRVDICAKFDCAKGFWPAVWLLPQGNSEPYSGGGEIDMMEHLNFDNFVYQTIHSRYTNLVNKVNPKNHVKPFVNINDFNVYSVEVHTDKLVFLINNEVTYEYPRITPKDPSQFPFDRNDYYVVLSSQIGGEWVGEVDLKGKIVKLEVDWVRVYQQK